MRINCSGEGYALLLSAGKCDAVFANHNGITGAHPLKNSLESANGNDVLVYIPIIRGGEQDIFANGRIE